MADATHYKVIRAIFQYTRDAEVFNPNTGHYETKPSVQYAFKGEILAASGLTEIDVRRGLHYRDLIATADPNAGAAAAAEGDPSKWADLTPDLFRSWTTEQVVEYMVTARPTEAQLMALVDGNVDAANVVRDAEDRVTDGDPRTGLVGQLDTIIEQGGTTEKPEYDDLTYPDLQKIARDRGLDPTGKQVELLARLIEDDQRNGRV